MFDLSQHLEKWDRQGNNILSSPLLCFFASYIEQTASSKKKNDLIGLNMQILST